MKKILLSGFLVLALAVALIVTFMVDPYTAKQKKTLETFHQNFVFLDGYLKDDFQPKVAEKIKEIETKVSSSESAIKQEKNKAKIAEMEKGIQPDKDLLQKMTAFEQELKDKTQQMTAIIDAEIMSKLVQDVQKTSEDELKKKTIEILPGMKKIIDLGAELDKNILPEFKEIYSNEKQVALTALYNDTQSIVGNKLFILKLIRFILIGLLVITSGFTFIFIERKARKTGEIKASEVI